MPNPRISVVMPVYNVEAYIAEAIRSVLSQTFENFELIIVDDGGDDHSVGIALCFNDPRIRIVSQKNRGLAAARNTGIANARAPYIALLDSDDRWHPDKLSLHYAHLKANPHVGVSYSGSRMIDQHGAAMSVEMRPKLKNVTAKDILCRNPVGNGSAPVLRRTALDRASFPHPNEPDRTCWFDETFRQSEDIELWVRLSTVHGVEFEGIDALLTDYRIIGGALSANVVKQYVSWLHMLEIVRKNAPTLVDEYGPMAKAYQLRYLARRSIQVGDGKLADDLFWRATRLSPKIHAEEPVKSAVTWAAIKLFRLVGPSHFRLLTRRYLKASS